MGLGDFAFQTCDFFGQTRFFGGHVHLDEQAHADIADHGHRRGLGGGLPCRLVIKHFDLAELGQGLQGLGVGAHEFGIAQGKQRHFGGGRDVHLAA